MDQFILFHFTVLKNERVYEFAVQPGAPWEDIFAVLEEFKEQMNLKKEEDSKKAEQLVESEKSSN